MPVEGRVLEKENEGALQDVQVLILGSRDEVGQDQYELQIVSQLRWVPRPRVRGPRQGTLGLEM